jgi:hypothetical protein
MSDDALRTKIKTGLEGLVADHILIHEAKMNEAKMNERVSTGTGSNTDTSLDASVESSKDKHIPIVSPGYVEIRTTDVTHKKVKTADGESTVKTTVDPEVDGNKNPMSITIGPIISTVKDN